MPPAADASAAERPRVLVTGAAGRIGSDFAAFAASRYRLRLMTLPDDGKADGLRQYGEVVAADLGELAAVKRAMSGVDACLHLAADADPSATWDRLLPTNVVGTYNVYAAAKYAGCRRVVFASSIHAVSGYPADVQVKTHEAVAPGDLYGVTKCFGEALARYMAEQEGVGGVAVRIGAYADEKTIAGDFGVGLLDAWLSPRDAVRLFCLALDATHVPFAVVHGVSNNRFKRLDLSTARELLGYAPEDDASQSNDRLRPTGLSRPAVRHSLADADDRSRASGLRNQLTDNT